MNRKKTLIAAAALASLAIGAADPVAHLFSTEGLRTHEHKSAAAMGESSILPAQRLDGGFACVDGLAADLMPCKGIDLLSYVPTEEYSGDTRLTDANPLDTQESSDMWGWTDPEDGREYIIIGKTNGVAFYDITDPLFPVHVGSIDNTAAVQLLWHDIKVYEDHAFIVSESNGHGMLVFDLTRLRPAGDERDPSVAPVMFDPDSVYPLTNDAHNLAINEETGYAYIVGGNHGLVGQDQCRSGLHIVDISMPTIPTFAGCYALDGGPGTAARTINRTPDDVEGVRPTAAYVHDTQCVVYRGPDEDYFERELCFNAAEDRVVIADVTNKALPMTVASFTYDLATYTHQAWLTEDHRYLLVNDELDEEEHRQVFRTRTIIFDLADLDDPGEAMIYNHAHGSIDHNLYVKGEGLYQSHYAAGLRVSDLDRVGEGVLEEVAFFDVHPDHDSATFFGTWSNYPYFESGTIAISGYEGFWLVKLHDEVIEDIND